MIQGLVIDMEEARLHTLAQVKASPDGAVEGASKYPSWRAPGYRASAHTDWRCLPGASRQGHVAPLLGAHDPAGATVPRARRGRNDTVYLGTRSPAALLPRTWPCWPKWMRGMVPCSAWPPRN